MCFHYDHRSAKKTTLGTYSLAPPPSAIPAIYALQLASYNAVLWCGTANSTMQALLHKHDVGKELLKPDVYVFLLKGTE